MSAAAPLPLRLPPTEDELPFDGGPIEADPYPPDPPPGEDELPYSDGVPMESERHAKQQSLLVSSLDRALRDRDDVYVGGNMFVYFSPTQQKTMDFRGPDVFVVLDTVRRERKAWLVWAEGGQTPHVVIELLSPSTKAEDRGEKMRIYARSLHVPNYFLFDPFTGALEGYQLDPNTLGYTRRSPTPEGDVPCPILGLRLGVRHGRYLGLEADWLRWIDAEGRVLPTAEEDAEAAERRAAAEATQREDAERRLAEALAEIERLKQGRGPEMK